MLDLGAGLGKGGGSVAEMPGRLRTGEIFKGFCVSLFTHSVCGVFGLLV